MRGKSIFCIYI